MRLREISTGAVAVTCTCSLWGEYRKLRPLRKLLYRFHRHPCVLFGIGPFIYFVIFQRFSFYDRPPVPQGAGRSSLDELRVAGRRWTDGMAARIRAIPINSRPCDGAGRVGRCVVVLRPAPFRVDLLAATRSLGLFRRRARGQLVLPAPGSAAVDHCRYRVAPHPSSRQPDPQLPTT